MKKILLFNLLLAMFFGVQNVKAANVRLNSSNFPDPAFRQYLCTLFNAREGDIINTNSEDHMYIETNLGIYSLQGIEYFSNLWQLIVQYNPITSLDLSSNTKLVDALISNNSELTSLNVTGLNLKGLNCSNNNLSSLNLTTSSNLCVLDCSNNNLSTLNVNSNPNLVYLYCSGNNLTSLNLSNTTKIRELDCSRNNITQLDDLWRCTELRKLDCSYNKLTGPLPLAAGLTKLEDLICGGNDFTSINLYYLTNLERLTLKESKVTSLDFSNNPNLHYLNCEGTPLGSIDLRHNTELDTLIVKNCDLYQLLITSGNNKLVHLDCSYNDLTKFYLPNYSQLKFLNCSYNSLPTLDISACTSLNILRAHHNKLISIVGIDQVAGLWSGSNSQNENQESTRRFERIAYNGGEALALDLGGNVASRISNLKVKKVKKDKVIYGNYLIVSDDLMQIPREVTYDFNVVSGSNMDVTVNYDVKDYNILIDGKQMTSLDMYNVPGVVSGKAYFEDEPDGVGWANEPTLVLENATLEWNDAYYGLYNENCYDLTIKAIGDCTINAPKGLGFELDIATNTTITGGGTLRIQSQGSAFRCWIATTLTIQDNTTVIANSTGTHAFYDEDGANLEIKDGGVFAVYGKNEPITYENAPILGEGIALRYPVDAYIGNYYVYNADGTKVQGDWVVFGPDTQATRDLITGVSPLGETEEGAAIYNLAGQRLSRPQKGIYITNGRKVLVK